MISGILFSKVISVLINISKRGPPDRKDKTHSANGVEMKRKHSGRTSQKTHTALVLTSNMQYREGCIQATYQRLLEGSDHDLTG
jgi:hypothetical protein